MVLLLLLEESNFPMLVGLEQISQSRVVGGCISLETPAPTHNLAKDVTWTNTSSSHLGTSRSVWDDEKTSLALLVDDLCQRDLCTWSAVDLIPRTEQLLSKGLRDAV